MSAANAKTLVIAALLSSGVAVAETETTFELDAEFNMAYGSHAEQLDQADLNLRPQLQLSFDNGSELTLSARLRWDSVDALPGDERALDTYTQASRPWQRGDASVELRDAYWERSLSATHVRIGKQQIVWGALDGLKLLDAVNPQDFREFILDDFDQSRISQWAVHTETPLAGGYLELALVPDTSAHELPAADAKFAFRAERFRFALPAGSGSNLQQRTERSNDPIRDATWALRFSRFTRGWDLAASVVSGPDHTPVGRLEQPLNQAPTLTRVYRDRTIFGFSAEKSFGSIALRTELALRPDRAFNRASNGPGAIEIVERDQLGVALAMDWQAPGSVFVNLQLLHERIHDHDDGFAAPEEDTLATALVRRNFRYDTVSTELRWYSNLADGDGLVRPSVSYQLGDNTRIRLGADFFYGTSRGLFGQYDQADQVTLTLQQVF